MNKVKLNIDYIKTANYALFHNRLPICQSVTLTNTTDHPIENLKITCEGEYFTRFESDLIAVINPGETVRLSNFKVSPDPDKLLSLTERVLTSFTLKAIVKDGSETEEPIASPKDREETNETPREPEKVTETPKEPNDSQAEEEPADKQAEEQPAGNQAGDVAEELVCEIELMPFDHWTGTSILPQTIASFITPNHPTIADLVVKSAAVLKELTGESAFYEYQTGNSNNVRQQVAAVFSAIHNLGIVYRSLPASFEEKGQRITLPDKVIASKIGNCLELTLLMASTLEAIGLNTLIVFRKGHAYLGVWLVDDCYPCSVSDDPAFIEKKSSRGINEMLLVECTHLTKENASFEEAVSAATLNHADLSRFEMFVDVKRSRLERIFPLPVRVEHDGKFTIETSGVDHDSCTLNVEEHDRYDLSRIQGSDRELTKFDIWERKLLDFSLRNSLLNVSLRKRAIQFISFEVNRIEDHLQKGKEYRISPKPDVEIEVDSKENLIRSKLHLQLQELIHNDIEHKLLHTYLSEPDTKDVLKNISRVAKNAIEETGANTMFLAIGVLRWYETEKSTKPRYAPLLMLPVEMVYKKGSYYIRTRDEEIFLNITLMEFLRQNFDITIKGLDPLPLDESGVDVPLIFAIIRDALKEQKRWDVEEEAVLGIFSFSKFMMWNDVHNHRDELTENDIIHSLLANRLTWTPQPVATDLKEADRTLSPRDIALPVAVDSSQMAAVLEGARDNSFILYGPPGTGKSQTITNLIANALYHGKRVLFVAEKMAALNVVQSRLAKIGLDPFCLELHSNKSTKRHVLEQLEKALKVVHIVSPSTYSSMAEKLFAKRKELIKYITALHTPSPEDGLSLYDYIMRYEVIDADPLPEFTYDDLLIQFLKEEGIKGVEEALGRRLVTMLKIVGNPSKHPLNGLKIERNMLADIPATTRCMKEDAKTLENLTDEAENLMGTKKLLEKILKDNSEAILEEDPETWRQEMRAVNAKWFLPKFFAKRDFIKKLRQFNPYIVEEEIEGLLQDLMTYRENHAKISSIHRVLLSYFDCDLKSDELPPSSELKEHAEQLNLWAKHSSEMRDWVNWTEYADELSRKGLGCVVEHISTQNPESSGIKDSYLKAFFKYKAERLIAGSDVLMAFEGMLFDEKIAAYRKYTKDFQTLTQKELYARLASMVPHVSENLLTGSEIGFLNRNISNGGRGQSLRDLFDKLPTLMPRLCPCMLMSPMSVAQFINLSADKFDLVVFDEASQMPTSEAIGAIARGKSLIVVGDPKQMPPTSFFTSSHIDVDEASIDDMESILEDCRTLEMPALQLSWHYRSRHESLIAFSNNEYYDGSLITFPSVDDKITKLHYVPVEGYYDKGGTRTNKAEAEAIVKEIERRLRDTSLRRQSIGVISFNVMQQALIEDLLQDLFDKKRTLQEAAAQMHEPIFIKNLENVQGDERDVIIFSIGYGPDKDGRVSMNFGPLNNPGGERRLNVAVSRARHEMYIFSTLRSAHIDLRRSKARGVEGLKHFLEYAETSQLPTVAHSHAGHRHSPIADRIASELKKLGYHVSTDVGRSFFRVDIAIGYEDEPDKYALAILLDGESYRDTLTTRDREIVQPSMLNTLGWHVMRVWSVDWINNKQRVLDRIIEKLPKIRGRRTTPPVKKPLPSATPFKITAKDIEKKRTFTETYQHADLSRYDAYCMSEREAVRRMVEAEQPVNINRLWNRLNRSGLRNKESEFLKERIEDMASDYYVDESGTWWLTEKDSHDYSVYRPDSGREIKEIPPIEIKNAIVETLEEQLTLHPDNVAMLGGRKLGFPRCSVQVKAAFRNVIEKMKEAGEIEEMGTNIRLTPKSFAQ